MNVKHEIWSKALLQAPCTLSLDTMMFDKNSEIETGTAPQAMLSYLEKYVRVVYNYLVLKLCNSSIWLEFEIFTLELFIQSGRRNHTNGAKAIRRDKPVSLPRNCVSPHPKLVFRQIRFSSICLSIHYHRSYAFDLSTWHRLLTFYVWKYPMNCWWIFL